MEKMILFITYENPFSKNTGDRIYTCNILDGISKLSEHIDIIYFDSNTTESIINSSDQQKFQRIEVVKFKKKKSINFIFSSQPGMIVNRKSNQYLSTLKDILLNESYNTIIVNHQKMMFTIPSLLKFKDNARLIYISHNVEYLLSANLVNNNRSFLKKALYWQDSVKTGWFERKWIDFFDCVTAISEHDADYFKEEYGISKVDILRPIIESNHEDYNQYSKKKINNIIIAGSFEWRPKKDNLLMFLNANNFHELSDNGINLTIVGRADSNFVNYVNNNYNGVQMTGEVLSLLPYYQDAKIAVIPERLGGGFKLKIIEAALYKTAIFAIKGAITKCNFFKNQHFIEKDTFEGLVSEIIKVQQEPEILDDLIENAFLIAKNDHTIDKLTNSLKKVI
jgi:glycosyltransferase involved in cell wall biosynthesis